MLRMLPVFILVLVGFVFAATVHAAQNPTSIAVVDVQALLTKSEAAISIEKQIDEYKERFVGEIAKQEQELRDMEKELGEQRSKLGKDEFASKAKAFEEKLIETRKLAEKKRRAFDEASAKALDTLRETLYGVVQELAREKGFTLVISKQNVILGEQSIDLTDETMTMLNKKVSSITLDIADK